ncbi:MAG: hypothetical protein EOP84_20450 [Verrucomicrobiaceae bacterium]|nr:MAG: hypothetical protein EOP84_20450 [Verrucomicrobiaceae bacterium]
MVEISTMDFTAIHRLCSAMSIQSIGSMLLQPVASESYGSWCLRDPMRSSQEWRRAMLYFFNLAGAVYDPDVEGVLLLGSSEARIFAVKFLADTLRDRPELVWSGEEVRVEVTNAEQLILFTVIVLGVDAPVSKGRRPPS